MSPTNTPPRAELIDQAAARPLRARSPPAYEPRSTMKARITMNHSKPLTRWPESHITAYASVVHGSRKKPSSGTTQLSNARLSRSLKIAMKNSASRAEISARSASRHPISGRQDLRLLYRELVVGQDALLLEVGEVLELLDRVGGRRGRRWGRRVLLRLLRWRRVLRLLSLLL